MNDYEASVVIDVDGGRGSLNGLWLSPSGYWDADTIWLVSG